jgi:5-methyltetrahydrofolate--homocysteine methyltransferase
MMTHGLVDVASRIAEPSPAGTAEPEPFRRRPDITVDRGIVEPPFLGARVVSPVWIDEIVGYVNQRDLWGKHWALQPGVGESEHDAIRRRRGMLYERLTVADRQELLAPQVAYGYFPVNSSGRDLIIWTDDTRTQERTRLGLTGQWPDLGSVADRFKPDREPDYAALQLVTLGSKMSMRLARRYPGETDADHRLLVGLAAALTDALTEYWHRRIRIEWGFADEDGPTLNLVLGGFYRGYRYPLSGEHQMAVAGLVGAPAAGDTYNPEYTAASLIGHHT